MAGTRSAGRLETTRLRWFTWVGWVGKGPKMVTQNGLEYEKAVPRLNADVDKLGWLVNRPQWTKQHWWNVCIARKQPCIARKQPVFTMFCGCIGDGIWFLFRRGAGLPTTIGYGSLMHACCQITRIFESCSSLASSCEWPGKSSWVWGISLTNNSTTAGG